MSIALACPECGEPIVVPARMAGRKATCPACSARVLIPDDDAADDAGQRGEGLPDDDTVDQDSERAARALLVGAVQLLASGWRRIPSSLLPWPALVLFFLPWIDVSCSGRPVARQSGAQVCVGEFTVAPGLDQQQGGRLADRQRGEAPPWSLLACLYGASLAMSAAALVCALTCVALGAWGSAGQAHCVALACLGACWALLTAFLLAGSPAEGRLAEAMEHLQQEQGRMQRGGGLGAEIGANLGAALVNVQVRYTPWLWLSWGLTFLALPCLCLEWALLAARRQVSGSRRRAPVGQGR